MAVGKMLAVRQFPLFNSSLNCLNALKKDYSSKKVLQAVGIPPKPKRPTNPYVTFQVTQRVEIAAKYPGKSFGEISKILGAKWNSLPEFEKSKYKEDFVEKQAAYKSQLHEYYQNHGNIDKKTVKELHNTISSVKLGKKETKKLLKLNNKPEFPNSPYKFFVQERITKMDLPIKERIQKCAELWRNLSEREKENFNKMYQQKYEQYQKELNKWEQKMIEQGKENLVRPETLKGKFTNK